MERSSSRSGPGIASSSRRSRATSALSVSAWELTETYSPAAIDMAPATSPATPATMMPLRLASAAATPTRRLAVDTMPSLAPRTAARSQPMRPLRWRSAWRASGLRGLMRLPSRSWPGAVGDHGFSFTITSTVARVRSHAKAMEPSPASPPATVTVKRSTGRSERVTVSGTRTRSWSGSYSVPH